ncbi:MAG: hypothetical protein QOJ52_1253, partial [Acidimicrobiaceae bacterium]|nr:hypothetical protein [Acidimicrobiaceae bacterium]
LQATLVMFLAASKPELHSEVDATVVAQARTGDVGAFGHIVDHYDRRLRALAYRLLGERDLMDDVLQEVYVKAFRALPRFKGDASLGTWLFRITYNTCIDELRGNPKVVRLFADGPGGHDPPSPAAGPEDVAIGRHDLAAALATLKPDQLASAQRAPNPGCCGVTRSKSPGSPDRGAIGMTTMSAIQLRPLAAISRTRSDAGQAITGRHGFHLKKAASMKAFTCGLALFAVLTIGGCGTQHKATSEPSSSVALTAPGSPKIAAQVAGMKKLGFMVGRWVGPGWSLGQKGERVEFTQTEQVTLQLSGELMTVQGIGRVRGIPSFSAFATATFDPATATYPWQAFSQGSKVETTLGVTDNRFTWSFDPTPGVTVRYAATFTKDTWHETGEMSIDGGKTWMPNLDMTLSRVAGAS